MKKSWNKPELTVLVRTRPEEAILGLCKNITIKGGRLDAHTGCFQDGGFGCEQCEASLDS